MEINKEVGEFLEAPLLIAAIKDKVLLGTLNNLIPYCTGFEIEGNYSKLFDTKNFLAIPYILDINCDCSEQRFRIPNGIRGIICLYLISRQLRINCELNMESGIHYHVDCTDVDFNKAGAIAAGSSAYLMRELDSWGYRRSYNARGVSYGASWIKLNDLKTLEFRIGEMTFDYHILLKRIIHVNELTRYIKKNLDNYREPKYEPCDFGLISNYLKLPYSLAAYSKDGITGRLAGIQRQIEELDKKTLEEPIQIRKRRHLL